ncbi:MAG TPA: NADH-quinone oxidoreductase subunit L [Candidatus Baltobacteraceae bacterium]|jgi:NADH-quinone oxidoreductase subunit L|nr:NADH-quinone oxidoreductase subunit L [Candidatus Baltobacteraceae bacterium]
MNGYAAQALDVIWLLPLLGALIAWTFGPRLRAAAGGICSAVVGLAFAGTLAELVFVSRWTGMHWGFHQSLVTWVPGFTLGLQLDPLSLIWSLIITGVGFLIHVYSIGYLAGDRSIARFFAYMNFFVFAMLTLVLSDNFVGLLVGWGLVGLASYFLIGYYIDRPSAVAAARKAFVINVFGDVGMMFAIVVVFALFGSVSYTDVFAVAHDLPSPVLALICLGLFTACAAKSAQVPLHTWLPDAMEGPTPVSALIHAATMVTAGVYLIARCAPLWSSSPEAQELVGVVGAITALCGALLGIVQWDIKRILAYSTMSQIGYMIMAVGVGAYDAGVLHFFTHAFFKALLFLAAGLIIHELANEQDIRKMGGLRKRMPLAFWAITSGVLAICGIPLFSGFYSKDAVIYGMLLHGHPILFAIGVLTAGLTAFYMFRMWFIVFFGSDRTEHGEETHASSWTMRIPVALLIGPTVVAGYLGIAGSASPWSRFLAPVFDGARPFEVSTPLNETAVSSLVLIFVACGILAAYLRYGSARATSRDTLRLMREAEGIPLFFRRAFYVDDFIRVLIVRPAQIFGAFLSRFIDPRFIDGLVHDVAWFAGVLGFEVRAMQNGQVRGYAFTLAVGVVAFIAYFTSLGGVR